ncbi:MAG: hypothetical protein V1809_09185 [Planctomycetota bacterium]
MPFPFLRNLVVRNWPLKITAMVLAVLAWAYVRGERPALFRTPPAQVMMSLEGAEVAVLVSPTFAGRVRVMTGLPAGKVALMGPADRLQNLESRDIRCLVELPRPERGGRYRLPVRIHRPDGIRIDGMAPQVEVEVVMP